jgi:hypothetical protein
MGKPKTSTKATETSTKATETAVVATTEVAPVANKKVSYPEVITFTLKHPVMEFDIDSESGKEIPDSIHKKKDENGEIVMQTRSFSKAVHGDDYVELAKEFYKTNTEKPVISSHNLPL